MITITYCRGVLLTHHGQRLKVTTAHFSIFQISEIHKLILEFSILTTITALNHIFIFSSLVYSVEVIYFLIIRFSSLNIQ